MVKSLLIFVICCLVVTTKGKRWFGFKFLKRTSFFDRFRRTIFPDLTINRLDSIEYPNAKCLDGSMGAYYISRPYKNSLLKLIKGFSDIKVYTSDTWVFYLQGGNLCFSEESCRLAAVIFGTPDFVSSLGYTDTIVIDGWLSRDCNINPDFCEANFVYLPYCSQDVWSGNREQPITFTNSSEIPFFEDPNGEFNFAGNIIVKSIIKDLKKTTNIRRGKDLLFGGVSAGALFNIDTVQSMLPQVNVKGLAVSGWLSAGDYDENSGNRVSPIVQDVFSFFDPSVRQNNVFSFPFLFSLYNVFETLTPCVPTFGLNCGSIDAFYQFIEAPIFVTEYHLDKTSTPQFSFAFPVTFFGPPPTLTPTQQLYGFYYISSLTQSLSQINTTKDGYFIANCFDHVFGIRVADTVSVAVNNETVTQAFGDWFFDRTPEREFAIIDSCIGINCNPTCLF